MAKQEALKEIDAATDEDSGMIIVFNSAAEIRQSYTTNRHLLRNVIRSIEPTQRVTRIEEALTLADGHLFITTKAGDLVLAPATPKGYQEKARLKILGDNRTSATVADRKLYLRDRKNILCLDIAGK